MALRNAVHAANSHRGGQCLLALGGMAGGAVTVMLFRGAVDSVTIGIMMILVCVVMLLLALPFARGRARRAGAACLEAGVCAACGYVVAGSEAGEDGYVVCSECGATWRAGEW